MSEWKVVPVDPSRRMIVAAGHVNSEWLNDNAPLGEERYQMPIPGMWEAALAVAPSPPVVLPPMPPDLNSHCKRLMRAYAISALAQYGIRGQSDE